MASIAFTVGISAEDVDPDGTECYSCGDACLLSMRAVYPTINGTAMESPVAVLCGSCRDVLDGGEFDCQGEVDDG